MNNAQKAVIKFLATNIPSTVEDIHLKIDVYKKTTFRAELNNLKNLGYTERVDYGGNGNEATWDLTAKGKQLARDEGFLDDSSEEPPW